MGRIQNTNPAAPLSAQPAGTSRTGFRLKFIHTADWQIGAQFGQFDPAEATHLAEARFDTVRTIAALATDRKADAVLVAGDVFDQQTVSDTVIRRLFGALSGFTGPWYLLPGNHDAAIAESVWTRAQRLGCVPVNAHLILTPGVINNDELRLSLVCAPLTQRNTFDDTTVFFDHAQSPEGYFRVGLAHGSVQGILPDTVDSANPLAPKRAEMAKLDYLALGDWHGTLQVDDRTWYAGTHEQDRFRANDPGNALEVTLEAPGKGAQVTPVRVGTFRWQRWDETISVPSDVDVLKKRLEQLAETDVLRIEVAGTADLACAEAVRFAIEETRARVRALRSNTSALQVLPTDAELAAIGGQGGYVANVVASLRDLQSDPAQAAVAAEALMLLAQIQKQVRSAA
jgi:DNA repair exonuclease SbcCD nuclease subunit